MATIELRFQYCISIPAILKWLEIIFSSIVLGLVLWEVIYARDSSYKNLTDGETFTVIVGFLTIAVCIVLLVVYFFNCHNKLCVSCRCRAIAVWIYVLLLCLWIAAAGVQTWATVHLMRSEGQNANYVNRRAASAAFCYANILCFIFAIQQAYYVDL